MVADYAQNNKLKAIAWSRLVSRPLLEREEVWLRDLGITLIGIELVEHNNDRIIWEFDKFGWFSIKKLSSLLDKSVEDCGSLSWSLF